jgi:hypothetical protein
VFSSECLARGTFCRRLWNIVSNSVTSYSLVTRYYCGCLAPIAYARATYSVVPDDAFLRPRIGASPERRCSCSYHPPGPPIWNGSASSSKRCGCSLDHAGISEHVAVLASVVQVHTCSVADALSILAIHWLKKFASSGRVRQPWCRRLAPASASFPAGASYHFENPSYRSNPSECPAMRYLIQSLQCLFVCLFASTKKQRNELDE